MLRRNGLIALCVGTLLSTVNQLDLILTQPLTPVLLLKLGANYLIPFTVASISALVNRPRDKSEAG